MGLPAQVAARGRSGGRVQPELFGWLGAIALAWIAACWLEASGVAHLLHHHTIYHSGQILAGGLGLLAAWQVMTLAMMLPGTLPAVLHAGRASSQLVFLGVYAVAWTGFAVVAFAGDMGLHALVHSWPLAAQHENLIPVAVLGLAAAYQVSPWKRAGLAACRQPAAIKGAGWIDALRAGIDYSRQCLLSGWALMLIMFSAGVAALAWMAALALAMLAEKTLPSGDGPRYVVASTLALLAAWTLLSA
jgi:predicted metal-binding membrane protein